MNLVTELRLAGRTLRRSPVSAIIAVVALGMGIGLSTLMFSIVHGAMLRGLPFDAPEQIVSVLRADRAGSGLRLPTIHDFAAWREGAATFQDFGAYSSGTVNISGGTEDRPERLSGAYLTPSTLRLLGVQPVAGRLLDDADDVEGGPPVMLLGHDIWQRRFGGDPAVVGRTIRANGQEVTVVGVLPDGFGFPMAQEVWLPLRVDADRAPWGSRSVEVVARMRAGIGIDAATSDLDVIAARLAADHPETHAGLTVRVQGFADVGDRDRAMLFVMLGAVAAVLVIACVNVTNLLIGRAIVRTKEVGIRVALGASRLRVALPFLAESAVLAVAGALVGVAVAYVGLDIFNRSVEVHDPPFWIRFGIDRGVLAFVAASAVLAALMAGVIPALQAARLGLHDTLKDESRGSSSFRLGRASRGLVIAELALSVALLVAAGLMVRSVVHLNTADLGTAAENVLVARVGLPETPYPGAEAQRRFAADLEAALATLPGASAVALSSSIPGRYSGSVRIEIEGVTESDARDATFARSPIVSPGYFEMFGGGAMRGRAFEARDDANGPAVVVVNAAFERRWLDGASAIGRRIRLGDGASAVWSTVVGVVPDLHESGIENPPPPAVYRPLAQAPLRFLTITARAPRPLDLVDGVRQQVSALDPDLPLYDIGTLRTTITDDNFRYGIFGGLFGTFGAVALALAAVGLYGVMSFSVGQRRREVGVRMALGARPADVVRLIVGQGMRQVALGLTIGTVLAAGMARLIASMLFDVSPGDPVTFAGILLIMATVGLLASAVPALRATRVDPLDALRAE